MSTRISGRHVTSFMRQSREERQKYDFDWAIGLTRISLEVIGIWPRKHAHKDALLRQLLTPLMVLSIIFCNLAPQMYALSQISRELTLFTDNLFASIIMYTIVAKLLIIWNNRSQLRPIIESVREDWSDVRRLAWDQDVMVEQAHRARIFFIAGYTMMMLSVVGFMATPFFGISVRNINNITDPYGTKRFFPLQIAYPFDAFITPRFEFIYFTQFASIAFLGFLSCLPDFLFSTLTFHASAQYEILADKFKLLFPQDLKLIENLMLEKGKIFQKQLKQFVLRHVHLIRFVTLIEDLFNWLILLHFIGMIGMICVAGFIITSIMRSNPGNVPVMQVTVYLMSMFTLLIQVLAYCFVSEVLIHHSSELHEAIYRSSWYLLPTKYSRNIIPVMCIAKFPLKLTAGKFVDLSLNSFCTILKTSAGYVSVLLSVNG